MNAVFAKEMIKMSDRILHEYGLLIKSLEYLEQDSFIEKRVSDFLGAVDKEFSIKTKTRAKKVVLARHYVNYLLRPKVGDVLLKKSFEGIITNHGTFYHSEKVVKNILETGSKELDFCKSTIDKLYNRYICG